MELFNKFKKTNKKITAFVLATVMALSPIVPTVSELVANAFVLQNIGDTGPVQLHVNSYCIDDSEMVGGGLWTAGDIYQRVPSAELGGNQASMFWLGVGLKAGKGDANCATLLSYIQANGVPTAQPVDEVVFKQFLHSGKVRAAHAWADQAAAMGEELLKGAGLVGGGSSSGSSGSSGGSSGGPGGSSSSGSGSTGLPLPDNLGAANQCRRRGN